MRRNTRLLLMLVEVTMMFALFGCGRTAEPPAPTAPPLTVSVVNEVGEADVWILPQTEANLKTTLWGTATVAALGAGETAEVGLTETEGAETWLVRILDREHAYYSARDLTLEDGYRIVFRTAGTRYEALIEVLDRSGTAVFSREAFTGTLGGG